MFYLGQAVLKFNPVTIKNKIKKHRMHPIMQPHVLTSSERETTFGEEGKGEKGEEKERSKRESKKQKETGTNRTNRKKAARWQRVREATGWLG